MVGAHVVEHAALDHGQDPAPGPDVLAQQRRRARQRVDLVLRDAVAREVVQRVDRPLVRD
jgi:hypothetical protein